MADLEKKPSRSKMADLEKKPSKNKMATEQETFPIQNGGLKTKIKLGLKSKMAG